MSGKRSENGPAQAAGELRLGIIGAGDVADRHAAGLLRATGLNVRLAAVAEPVEARRESFAAKYGISFVTGDYRLLLTAKEIDAVLILTPHNLHAAMTLAALSAGKDVICEKPMAPVLADCDRMLDAAREEGRKLFVTHALRGGFFYRTAARRLADGALGRPLAGVFRWFTDEAGRLDAPGNWKGTKHGSGGGVLIDGGCHTVDLANAFFGCARRVQALAGKLVAGRKEVEEDTAAFTVQYESGALASFFLSFTAGSSFRPAGGFAAATLVDLYGTEGHIEGGFWLRGGVFRTWCEEHRSGEADRHYSDDGTSHPGDIDRDLVLALRGEAPPPLTALDARNAVAVIDAAYESLATGKAVEVDWRDE